MSVWDDVDMRKCGHCGLTWNAAGMSCMAGRWLCKACYDAGRKAADRLIEQNATRT